MGSRSQDFWGISWTLGFTKSPRARGRAMDVLFRRPSTCCHPVYNQTANIHDCFFQEPYIPKACGPTIGLGFVFEVVSSRSSVWWEDIICICNPAQTLHYLIELHCLGECLCVMVCFQGRHGVSWVKKKNMTWLSLLVPNNICWQISSIRTGSFSRGADRSRSCSSGSSDSCSSDKVTQWLWKEKQASQKNKELAQ